MGINADHKFPVLIVHGDQDKIFPVDFARENRDKYKKEGMPALSKDFALKNVMEVPKVEKIEMSASVVVSKFAAPLSPSTMLLPSPVVIVSAPKPPTMTLLPFPTLMVSSPP